MRVVAMMCKDSTERRRQFDQASCPFAIEFSNCCHRLTFEPEGLRIPLSLLLEQMGGFLRNFYG